MADLNKYSGNDKNQQDPTMGDKLKAKAEAEAKKKVKKEAKNKAKDGFHKATNNEFRGLSGKMKDLMHHKMGELGRAAKEGAKKLGQAAGKAVSTVVEFLVSNPVGWVISAILIIIIIVLITKAVVKKKKALEEQDFLNDVYSESIMLSDADCKGIKKKAEADAEEVEADAKQLETAKKIYAVFHEKGLNDEMIAGMLGNMEVESMIDPSTVEGLYGIEKYQIGPRKQEVLDDMHNYCRNTLFPMYDNNGTSYDADNYKMDDGKYYCGLGLCQWTQTSSVDLVKTAEGNNWYDLEFQLAYMLSDKHHRVDFFKNWLESMEGSDTPENAAYYFRATYESNTENGVDEAKDNARKWYDRITSENWGGQEDSTITNFVTSLFELAGNLANAAIDTISSVTKSKCASNFVSGYDNSSLASAAVSYAYATHEESKGNKGTPLYQKVHDAVFPGDTVYMSCDRSVGTAVRWTGMDIDFPAGTSDTQLEWMEDHPETWEKIGMSTDEGILDQLQPGDRLAIKGHILMYTGHELIEERHGDKALDDADSVSGSLGERSPGCGHDTSEMIKFNGGQDWGGRGAYSIFRCKNTKPSDKYKDAGG